MGMSKLAIALAVVFASCVQKASGDLLEQEGPVHTKNATRAPSSLAQHKAGLNASMMAEPSWEFKPYFDELSEHGPFFEEFDIDN